MSATFAAGANDYLVAASNLAAMAGVSKVTVSLWAKWPATPTDNSLILEFNGDWTANSGTLYFSPFTTLGSALAAGTHGDVGFSYGVVATPSINVFRHFLFEIDYTQGSGGELVGLWINNVLQSPTLTNSNNTGTFPSAKLSVGARFVGAGPSAARSSSTVDDVAMWAGANLGSGDRGLIYAGHPNDGGLSVQPDYYWPLQSDGTATTGGINFTVGSGVTFDGNLHSAPAPSSFTISPTTVAVWPSVNYIPGNSSARVPGPYKAIQLSALSGTWTGSPFGVTNAGSGVATLQNQKVVTGTSGVVYIDEGNVADTLHITDGSSTTDLTLSAAAATHNQLICIGDSLTVQFSDGAPYPHYSLPRLGKDWSVYAYGIGGTAIDAFPWTNAESANPYNAAAAYSGAATLAVFSIGGVYNDLAVGSPPSAATLYAKYKSHIATVKAYGANVRIIVWTVPIAYRGAGGLSANPNISTDAANFNAALMTGFTSGDLGAHIMIDLASDPRWNEALDGYDGTVIQGADFTHWKTLIASTLGDMVAGACKLLADGGGSVPGSGGGGGGAGSGIII